MIEIAAKDVVFHFNKKHLEDASIPPWVLKCNGKSWYVNHVTCELPWSTKETPHGSTKGAIKVKRALVQIDDENHATLVKLTKEGEHRARAHALNAIIIGWRYHERWHHIIDQVPHSEIQVLESGGCSSDWWACEIYSEEDWTAINLQLYGHVRRFMPNEWQFKDYQSGAGVPAADVL